MGARLTGALVGLIFGVTLSWTGMSSPDVIREALLFENAYLFLFFGSAVVTAFVGLRVLRAARVRAVVSPKPIAWKTALPKRDTLVGSVLFGIGWGVSDACPGPIATQLGQGVWWSLFTIAGLATGITLHLRRQRRPAPTAFVQKSNADSGKPAFGSSRS